MNDLQILIAEVSDDLRPSKKRLIEELKKARLGDKITFNIPPPFNQKEHDKLLDPYLNDCQVTIHLLGEYSGRFFEDDEISILYHQATKGIRASCKKIFWIPKNLDFESVQDNEYREFLRQLEFGIDNDDDKYYFMKGDPQTLHEDIVKELNPPKVSHGQGVLIVHHPRDENAALDIKKCLSLNADHIKFSSGGDNPNENLKILGDQLNSVKKVIIVVGAVNQEWAKERTKHIISSVITNDLLIDSITLLFTPSSSEIFSFNNKLLNVKIIDNRKSQQIECEYFKDLFDQD